MASLNVNKLTEKTKVTDSHYFFDANVWIYALQGDELLEPYQKTYSNFFYKAVEAAAIGNVKVVISTLLISEIINTYLSKVAFDEYKKDHGVSELKFKKGYRPTQHYKDHYAKICDDIMGFEHCLVFKSDEALISNPEYLLKSDIYPFDFNDHAYHQFCLAYQREQRLTVVTNDGDFKVDDIPILTTNKFLLDHRTRK